MSTARVVDEPTSPAARRATGRPAFHVTDLLVPAACALWAVGVARTDPSRLGAYGLPAVLPLVYYAGLALLVVSAAVQLARHDPVPWRMWLHVLVLVVMLYGTAPLVYAQGRYSWLYKTVGVVQYVNAHGRLDGSIDIYQNWSGFFALTAWFGKVAGVGSPLAYAKWWQLVVELAALPLLQLIYRALPLTNRQRWVALLLYPASNWIAQDYFSPQSVGTLLSLGIMALAVRWLVVRPTLTPEGEAAASTSGRDARDTPTTPFTMPRRPRFVVAAVCVLYFVLTFTHELSPYIVAVQLGALALVKLLRPRWLPLLLAAIAVGYLLPHFGFVNRKYGLLASLGNFFSNVAPPAFSVGPVPLNQEVIQRCAELLSVGMWGLAVVAAWLRRRRGRAVLALVLLAFSPFTVLALQAYGQEGVLRVYLFSLPWTAALVATVLAPSGPLTGAAGSHHRGRSLPGAGILRRRTALPSVAAVGGRVRRLAGDTRLPRGALRTPLVVGVVLALFFPSFFGDDTYDRMPATEVATITAFERTAVPGPVYPAIDNGPFDDTSRYNLYPLEPLFGADSMLGGGRVPPDVATVIAAVAAEETGGRTPAYVVVAPSMVAYNSRYPAVDPNGFTVLLDSLARSPLWTLVADHAGTVVYELLPQVQAAVPRVRIPATASRASPIVP